MGLKNRRKNRLLRKSNFFFAFYEKNPSPLTPHLLPRVRSLLEYSPPSFSKAEVDWKCAQFY
jgi:hypothetical protein